MVKLKDSVSGTVDGMIGLNGNFKTFAKVYLKSKAERSNVLSVNGVSYLSKFGILEHPAPIKTYGSLQEKNISKR